MKTCHRVGLFCLGSFLFQSAAFAYIDPGTGSYLFQILAAAVLGSLFGIKMAWNRIVATIRSLFGRTSGRENEDDDL